MIVGSRLELYGLLLAGTVLQVIGFQTNEWLKLLYGDFKADNNMLSLIILLSGLFSSGFSQ
jgi:hypothetical protein